MADDDVQAVRAVARLARLLECSLDGLTPAQYRVLAAVDAGGERATHLAHGLALAKPTVTAAVDGLVERGLLSREPVVGDRRSLRIALTPAGRDALAAADAAACARLAAVLAAVDDPAAVTAALAGLAPALDGAMTR
ncbi:MAG: MarR family winged helix-turn-helix transcriptional regulator [Acidimicrobiia bacterium]